MTAAQLLHTDNSRRIPHISVENVVQSYGFVGVFARMGGFRERLPANPGTLRGAASGDLPLEVHPAPPE